MHRHVLVSLALLTACASEDEVAALRQEVQAQKVQIAQLEERLEQQGERLEAQSAILARLDDARMAAAEAPEPVAEAPGWLVVEGDRMVLLRSELPEPGMVLRELRAIPHRGSDGEQDGYRISGIRRSSPVALMGLRNGDVVHSVGGVNLSDLDGVMASWRTVSEKDRIDVHLTRRGQPRTLTFEVR